MELDISIGDETDRYVIRERKVPKDCKAPQPIILLSSKAKFKSSALCKIVIKTIGRCEAFAFCIGEEMGRVDDIIIPKQSATFVSVHVLPESVKECADQLKEMNKEREERNKVIPSENEKIREENKKIVEKNKETVEKNALIVKENEGKEEGNKAPVEKELPLLVEKEVLKPMYIVGWTHSHVDFGTFSSGTDDHEHEMLHDQLIFTQLSNTIPDDVLVPRPFYIVGITVNAMESQYPVVYASLPCGYRLQYEAKAVKLEDFGKVLTEDEMKELAREIYKEVQLKVSATNLGLPKSEYSTPSRSSSKDHDYSRVSSRSPSRSSTTLNDFLKDIPMRPESAEKVKKGKSPSADEVYEKFSHKETWKMVNKDEKMVSMLSKIQKLLIPSSLKDRKGDFSDLYDDIKKTVLDMLHEEHGILATILKDILGELYDPEDDEKCSVCGDPIDEDDIYHDAEGNHLCEDCHDELEDKENSTEEVGKLFDEAKEKDGEDTWMKYFDDEDNAIRCFDCKKEFNDDVRFSKLAGGMPICTACDKGDIE